MNILKFTYIFYITICRYYKIYFYLVKWDRREKIFYNYINKMFRGAGLKHLNKGGKVVVHDTLPENGFRATPKYNGDIWNGTGYDINGD